jgi:hypothetical protein
LIKREWEQLKEIWRIKKNKIKLERERNSKEEGEEE